ncbi:hypothetical protein Pcinc_002475 [Petrolisthes cinctipes]|uniref:Uncharacterized protein n=1 Tax=Petrolisthes cinctipes TaxID=88211 RepID=A0AAE1GIK9_PETCI|nr:hypothetical protein Pcinc_002475 [Petrolisthes cinctipes]
MEGVTGAAVKDRIIQQVGKAIKQAQIEWCVCGRVHGSTGQWLILSLDAVLLHGLRNLVRGYWSAVSTLLDRTTLATITSLPYVNTSLDKGPISLWVASSHDGMTPRVYRGQMFYPGMTHCWNKERPVSHEGINLAGSRNGLVQPPIR